MKTKITIGTRKSKLALWQANYVKLELEKHFPDLTIELKEISTKGDKILDTPLSKIGGKGLFTKEIEEGLLKKEVDLAVHSLKDLPTKLPDGLKIVAITKREKPHDVLIGGKFKDLKSKSRIGTTSLRRVAQLKAFRDDLEYLDLRGNLDTRIKKLQDGEYDAIIVAYAGIKRLGLENLISEEFDPKIILPAIGQGAMAIEIREDDKEIEKIISNINDKSTYLSCLAERSFLETLQGNCQTPIGAYSEIKEDKITLYGLIASLNGKKIVRNSVSGHLEIYECKKIGKELGEKLLLNGGRDILKEIVETPHWGVSTDI